MMISMRNIITEKLYIELLNNKEKCIKYIKNSKYSAVTKSFFQPERPMKSAFLLCEKPSCNG